MKDIEQNPFEITNKEDKNYDSKLFTKTEENEIISTKKQMWRFLNKFFKRINYNLSDSEIFMLDKIIQDVIREQTNLEKKYTQLKMTNHKEAEKLFASATFSCYEGEILMRFFKQRFNIEDTAFLFDNFSNKNIGKMLKKYRTEEELL